MAREMKDSGIAWIGEIPKEWKVLPAQRGFKEIKRKNTDGAVQNALQFKYGEIIPKNNFDADRDDYVADTITSYTIVEPGTVMINGLNLNYDFKTQRTGLVKEKGIITSAYLALWPNRSMILPEFATYLFKGYETRMALHNMGAGIRLTLGFKELKKQPVLFPSLDEQNRIVRFLDEECVRIDALIEQTRASIEEYKRLKQAIITEAVTKGVRGPRPMKDSGVAWIGEIPAEWELRKLKAIITLIESGVSVNAAQTSANEEKVGVLKTSCVSKFIFIPSENKEVNEDEIHRVSCPVTANTIIVSRMNTPDLVGACGYVESDYPNLFLPDRLWQVHFSKDTNVKFLWYYLNCKNVRNYYASLAVGTSSSMQNISQDQFYNTVAPFPATNEQNEIVLFLDNKTYEIDRLIESKQQLLTELEAYKKSVIYEYVTGKKEVFIG